MRFQISLKHRLDPLLHLLLFLIYFLLARKMEVPPNAEQSFLSRLTYMLEEIPPRKGHLLSMRIHLAIRQLSWSPPRRMLLAKLHGHLLL